MARSKSEHGDTAVETESDRSSTSPSRRINVAVTQDMLAAIDLVIEREQVTLTEAVRRLIGYGEVMYRAVKEDGQTILFRSEEGKEREVLLI